MENSAEYTILKKRIIQKSGGMNNNRIKKTIPGHHKIDLMAQVELLDGKPALGFPSSSVLQYFLRTKCKIGDKVSIRLENRKPKRSVAQNSFYHLYLSLISLSSGHSLEELKAWVKGKFLSQGVSEVFGNKVRVVKSTTDLTVSEFVSLMIDIEAETGIPLPDPEPFNLSVTWDEYRKLKVEQLQEYKSMEAKI